MYVAIQDVTAVSVHTSFPLSWAVGWAGRCCLLVGWAGCCVLLTGCCCCLVGWAGCCVLLTGWAGCCCCLVGWAGCCVLLTGWAGCCWRLVGWEDCCVLLTGWVGCCCRLAGWAGCCCLLAGWAGRCWRLWFPIYIAGMSCLSELTIWERSSRIGGRLGVCEWQCARVWRFSSVFNTHWSLCSVLVESWSVLMYAFHHWTSLDDIPLVVYRGRWFARVLSSSFSSFGDVSGTWPCGCDCECQNLVLWQ